MSAGAHNGADDIAFYEADLGLTVELPVNASGAQTSDEGGPLPAGRYLIQAFNLTDGGVCWVHTGKYKRGSGLPLVAAAGRNRIPLTGKTLIAVETHVREGSSDRVGAITSAGATCTLWITQVSTRSPG